LARTPRDDKDARDDFVVMFGKCVGPRARFEVTPGAARVESGAL
jgi:hypothetical protein